MLDPRLVPWPAVILGLVVALPFALAAFFFWGRTWPGELVKADSSRDSGRLIAAMLLAAAPVAGWAASIWKLQGLPGIPPIDAPLWALWMAAAAVAVTGLLIPIFRLPRTREAGKIVAMLIIGGALYYCIIQIFGRFVLGPDRQKLNIAAITAAVAAMFAVTSRPGTSAEYAPWCVGLTAASVCLVLTGTASVSLLALTLSFVALPGALVILIHGLRSGKSSLDLTALTIPAATLPLAAAYPILILAGPSLASTSWETASALLQVPVTGLLALRLAQLLLHRFERRGKLSWSPWKLEVLLVLIALIASGIPAAIVSQKAIKAAAEEEQYY